MYRKWINFVESVYVCPSQWRWLITITNFIYIQMYFGGYLVIYNLANSPVNWNNSLNALYENIFKEHKKIRENSHFSTVNGIKISINS